MPRWILPASVVLLVIARAAVFLVHPESYFDADQAIVGLMAKHLSELRAFPVFLYGQTYMLGVEAWLAAPLFAMFGPTIAALKLPLLGMNIAIALIVVATFQRELGLTAGKAFAAALPFIVPPVGLSAVFMDSSGGSLEPYFYVVLLWTVRRRAWLCGLVFGVGFLNREFTVYGLAAMALLEAIDGTLWTRAGLARWTRIAGIAVLVFLTVQGLEHISSASGPGTTVRDTFTASNNLAELVARTCLSPARAVAGAGRLFTIHWPAILGTAPLPLAAFSIESRVSQGLRGTSWLPAAIVLLSAAGIVLARTRRASGPGSTPTPAPRFAQYLVAAGLFSVAGYLFGRCGEVSFYSMRYELLSLLAIVGLAAWFLSVRPPAALLALWSVAFGTWIALMAVPHVRFAIEAATDPPVSAKHALIETLHGAHVRYGTADYWLAYYIDFLTQERMIFAADAPQRILLYNRIVAEHAAEAVRLSRRRCDGGVLLVPGVYRCP
jgi:hypothetical protein